MNNEYRVAMKGEVNGQSFIYAMRYKTSGKLAATHCAIKDFGSDICIVEVRRVN